MDAGVRMLRSQRTFGFRGQVTLAQCNVNLHHNTSVFQMYNILFRAGHLSLRV